MKYDGIISLGSFCHVGGSLWVYGLKNINSPLDNFGIKTWNSIIPILQNRFEDYWDFENVSIGKAVDEYCNKYNDKRMMLKAYCNKYNLVSNHNFILEENSETELKTFPFFKQKMKTLQDIFLSQCKNYSKVRFVCKAMNWPNPQDTIVTKDMIHELLNTLSDLRQGKEFLLSLAVPEDRYNELKKWSVKNEIPNLHIAKWTTVWNNEKNEEWDDLFGKDSSIPELSLIHI